MKYMPNMNPGQKGAYVFNFWCMYYITTIIESRMPSFLTDIRLLMYLVITFFFQCTNCSRTQLTVNYAILMCSKLYFSATLQQLRSLFTSLYLCFTFLLLTASQNQEFTSCPSTWGWRLQGLVALIFLNNISHSYFLFLEQAKFIT